MQSNELETIAAAIQDALHRAYAPGRSDAAHNDNAKPAGAPGRERHQASSSPGTNRDFPLDSLYPLGAKQ